MLCRHDSIRVKHPEYRHDSHPAFPIGAFSLLHISSHSFRAQIQKKKKNSKSKKKKRKKDRKFPAQNLLLDRAFGIERTS